ncbi:MAG: 1-acyl-sn-glycerol-3-phosphate acyltransferase [Myxococcales bacterium]|nr:1-acyl-sn-glycerol-3-phosphate acyltransferase [Myxococcales bacterium]
MRRRPIDWVVTLPFLTLFGLILLVFDPLQRVARLFGRRPHEVVAGALQVSLLWAFRLTGTRVSIERSPQVLPHQAYLVLANHQSMFDIPILGAELFTNYPKYVSKRELARWIPSISYNLRRGGNALIERRNREQATRAIRELGATVTQRGVSAVLYPEGTRARHGELGRFRPAGALALLESAPDIPIVPAVIDGSWRLLRFNLLPLPFGTEIRVRIGDPIPRSADEDRMALLAQVREQISRTLEGWRDEKTLIRS